MSVGLQPARRFRRRVACRSTGRLPVHRKSPSLAPGESSLNPPRANGLRRKTGDEGQGKGQSGDFPTCGLWKLSIGYLERVAQVVRCGDGPNLTVGGPRGVLAGPNWRESEEPTPRQMSESPSMIQASRTSVPNHLGQPRISASAISEGVTTPHRWVTSPPATKARLGRGQPSGPVPQPPRSLRSSSSNSRARASAVSARASA